jgi:cellulose biosynthesis protein BcsQ
MRPASASDTSTSIGPSTAWPPWPHRDVTATTENSRLRVERPSASDNRSSNTGDLVACHGSAPPRGRLDRRPCEPPPGAYPAVQLSSNSNNIQAQDRAHVGPLCKWTEANLRPHTHARIRDAHAPLVSKIVAGEPPLRGLPSLETCLVPYNRWPEPVCLRTGTMTKATKPRSSARTPRRPVRATRIALFNHKGGVSKTTTCFHLGWMLAQKGHRVVLVDADPQCNLSGLILGYKGQKDFENFYKTEPDRNLRAGLAPAFESRPKMIEAVSCVPVAGNQNLFLLPGHIGLSEYEVTLGIAQELSGSIQTLQNLPGSLSFLLTRTAEHHSADIVLVDMNPSLSSINQNLLMTCDYFMVPTSPDYFSVMAIDSLTAVIPRWRAWASQAAAMKVLQDATYAFPNITPKFLGTVVQKYRIRDRSTAQSSVDGGMPSSGKPAEGFQRWITEINKIVQDKFLPMLGSQSMLLPDDRYTALGIKKDRSLAEISDFNSLIAKSQDEQTPVFALTDDQIGLGGVLLERTKKSQDMFRDIFAQLANIILTLIN